MPSTLTDIEFTRRQLIHLRDDVDDLLSRLTAAESSWSDWLAAVAPEHAQSSRNMLHYWAIRQLDLRDLQTRLSAHGLSSLGRSEPHVEVTLLLVRAAISAMLGNAWSQPALDGMRVGQGPELLRDRTRELLGPDPVDRGTRIMVTLPSAASTDPGLVYALVERGMNVARINCAHDDAGAWRAMARHVGQAAEATGRTCVIAMDLGGPKLRTGPLEPGPRTVKLKPRRNALGQVVAPTRAWLTAAEDPTSPPEVGMVSLPVSGQWLGRRHDGDVLHLHDTRGAKRRTSLKRMTRTSGGAMGFVATFEQTTYLATGSVLHVEGSKDPTHLGRIPQTEQSLILHCGDVLELTRDCAPAPILSGRPPRIGCTLPELFDRVRMGQTVHLDDGRIRGKVVSVGPAVLGVRIDHAADAGSRLRGGKGINVPGADLPISALTDKDVEDLSSVIELADIVEMSFVRSSADVTRLLDELALRGGDSLGIVLKIETRQAFEHLPQLLLTLMRHPRVGVMIARGDLAVECGYERLAELQEEILWLCEAAHLPVIWATQVLEQLAKTGNPSRAEVSDAAMSERAECVMLNKGPYINDAVVVLDVILRRMADHHYKKTALMPSLHAWHPNPDVDAGPDARSASGTTAGVARVKVTSGRLPSERVDGAWWPRSTQLSAELPALLSALSNRLGRVVAVGYPRDGWRDVPPHLDVDGHQVHLLCLSGGDRTTVILIARDGHHLTLRVIAPETGAGAAQAALAKIPDRPNGDAAQSKRAALPRSLGDVAEKLAQHEGRHDDERAADIMRWCVEAATQFQDAPIQSFVPILVEHVVHDRMAETR